jgi:hypothetical protein
MSYFNKFPSIVYTFDFPDGPRVIRVKDVALNVRIRRTLLDLVTIYDEYDIESGETMDSISFRLYGTHSYHWILMLLNERYDYLKDMPKSDLELQLYTEIKYGVDSVHSPYMINGHRYYTDTQGIVILQLSTDRFALMYPEKNYENYYRSLVSYTNLEYETSINEAKRRIKVLNKQSISEIATQLERLVNV